MHTNVLSSPFSLPCDYFAHIILNCVCKLILPPHSDDICVVRTSFVGRTLMYEKIWELL